MSKCRTCGLRLRQIDGRWLHADDGQFNHPGLPVGFIPPPRKPFKAPQRATNHLSAATLQLNTKPTKRKFGATGAVYLDLKIEKKNKKRGRLPHGSAFNLAYDAASQTWSGTLVIDGLKFTAKQSGLFKCCEELDGNYRKFLQGKEAEKRESAVKKLTLRHIVDRPDENRNNPTVTTQSPSLMSEKNPPQKESVSGS